MDKDTFYTFSVETRWTIFSKYKSYIEIWYDRVKIKREGRIGDIPEEVTVHFDNIASITYTKDTNYLVSYISFTGLSKSNAQSISGLNIGNTMAASSIANPWSDPYGIVFKMDMYEEVKPYYQKMCEVFEAYRENNTLKTTPNIIMEDSPIDKLKKLKELKDLCIISEEEYQQKRSKILLEI